MSLRNTLDDITQHAAQAYPRECCGVVIVERGKSVYVPCRNVAESNEHFVIHPDDYCAAEDRGEVVKIVHSHPNAAPSPSQADRVGCELSGVPWLIINWPTGAIHEFSPSGYQAPLVGREFSHGVLDCYTLVRDYFLRELNIALPDFDRDDSWWAKGQNLYLDGFKEAGFVQVPKDSLKPHDGLLMQVAAPVPNHAAIWLGNGLMLHHMMKRLSSRDVYGGWYRKIHTHTLRHRSLM